MMKKSIRSTLVIAAICMLSVPNVIASAFSGQGIGLGVPNLLGANGGRAGLGLAALDTVSPNPDQPASMADMSQVHMSIGGLLQVRGVQDSYGNSGNQGEFRFGGFGVATPLYKMLRIGMTITPVTNVRTVNETQENLGSLRYTRRLDGTGGLTRYALGVAGKWNWLRAGVDVGVYAGSINNAWQVFFDDAAYRDGWFTVNRQMLGFTTRLGLIGEFKTQRWAVALTAPSTIRVREEVRYEATDRVTNTKHDFSMPMTIQAGNAFHYKEWNLGTDVEWTPWSDNTSDYFKNTPVDAFGAGLWFERPAAGGLLSTYLERMSYSGAIRYRKLQVVTSNKAEVDEWTTAAGIGFPFTQSPNRVHLAMGYTVRGDLSKNHLQENIVWTGVSVSIAEKWFVREKPTRHKRVEK